MSTSNDVTRILVIDDNPAIHNDFRKVLITKSESQELDDLSASLFGDNTPTAVPTSQFEIVSAHQGQEGFERLQESVAEGQPFSLAFVDMRMPPGWDGLETIENLWKVDPDLLVVICSAYSDHSWSEVVERLGNNDRWLVLKKPFDNTEVCQMAAALAERRRLSEQVQRQMEHLTDCVNQRTQELREREERMKAMFETAPDGIITFDAHGFVESANIAALSMFCYELDELVGKNILELIAVPEDSTQFNVFEWFQIGANVTAASQEFDSIRQYGNTFPSHWTVGFFSNASHQFFTAIVRDQTEYVKLQCELAQAQKLEAVGQLAAGIAHEINTPTQYLGDNVRFLQEVFEDLCELTTSFDHLLSSCSEQGWQGAAVDEAQKIASATDLAYINREIPRTIDDSLHGIETIRAIVGAMKEFSHPGSHAKTLTNIHHSLLTTITVSRNEWKYVADVETDFDPDMPQIPCLIRELNQAFLNIIVNAAHAIADAIAKNSEEKGTIRIRTSHSEEWVEIEISDTGTGMSEKVRNRVFDPFFTTKPVGKGTGQGLAIARSVIVTKHQGTIDVQSQQGHGTTFRIRLPRKETPESNASTEHRPHESTSEPESPLTLQTANATPR